MMSVLYVLVRLNSSFPVPAGVPENAVSESRTVPGWVSSGGFGDVEGGIE
jgi:hypothetical protein